MKILIPLDGSRFAEAVLEPLAVLVASCDAELILVEVVKESEARATLTRMASTDPHEAVDPGVAGVSGGSALESAPRAPAETQTQAQDRIRQEVEDYLSHINEKFAGSARVEVIWGEDAAQAIIDYAGKEKVDLIAMATHGRRGLARMLMGSVASTLLQAQVAPLFMVRPTTLHE